MDETQLKHIVYELYNDFIENDYDDVKDDYSCWDEMANMACAFGDYISSRFNVKDYYGIIEFESELQKYLSDYEYNESDHKEFLKVADNVVKAVARQADEFAFNHIHKRIFLGVN